MDIALFCTLSISSLEYLGNELWKTCAQYSRTGLIVTQFNSIQFNFIHTRLGSMVELGIHSIKNQ